LKPARPGRKLVKAVARFDLRNSLKLGIVLAVIGALIVYFDNPPGRQTDTGSLGGLTYYGQAAGRVAPPLEGISHWLNGGPVEMEALRGKVVLVDFWTYSCVNCVRTFPYLRDWHYKYADKGLVIIGVHTPEFEFEKVRANVEEAVQRYELPYLVAMDNDRRTWRAYENRYWPRDYLIDKTGMIRYDHIGEGDYETTEQWIQVLLAETGVSLPDTAVKEGPQVAPEHLARLTRELYGGYDFGVFGFGSRDIGNEIGHMPNQVVTYSPPDRQVEGWIYLNGPWFNHSDRLSHAGTSIEDFIQVRYYARKAQAVLGSEDGAPVVVTLVLDGAPLDEASRGDDVTLLPDGRSVVVVDGHRLYNLVSTPDFGTHQLRLTSDSDRFSFYTFTFGW